MTRWTADDIRYMEQALALAWQGQGFVEPNPMVGCVIVRRGRVVGQGWHQRYGGPHAEPNALRAAGSRAAGATVYVSLEPCCHYGKTPPCTEALIRAGVARVVAAMRDPNPLVAGKGLRKLRAAGIQTEVGLLRESAEALNAPFIVGQTKNRPYVILKWAQSIDGKIATRTGDSKWITSQESRAHAHALRARVDGIVVGVETILRDDPALTARLAKPRRIATRIVLDPHLRTPPTAEVVRTARRTPTTIVTAAPTMKTRGRQPLERQRRIAALKRKGCAVLEVQANSSGLRLEKLLTVFREQAMTNIMVEGGGKTLGAFLQSGLADAAQIYVATRLIGGETAPGPLRGTGPKTMHELPAIESVIVHNLGGDLCYNMVFWN